jgi:hypothetical protein
MVHGIVPVGLFVCHDCPGGDNPTCVNPNHLFLGSHQENLRDASNKGMLSTAKDGEKNPGSLLNDQAVIEIRKTYDGTGAVTRSLASKFGVQPRTISDAAKRVSWKHIT